MLQLTVKNTLRFLLVSHNILRTIFSLKKPAVYNLQSWAKVADMLTLQFKFRTCGCGLFLILVRNSASFIQILKILSIFVKYFCFDPVKHEKQFNLFQFTFGKNIKFFFVQADKNTKSAFRLNRFLFVDMLFWRVRRILV